jgi:hypothetical protein
VGAYLEIFNDHEKHGREYSRALFSMSKSTGFAEYSNKLCKRKKARSLFHGFAIPPWGRRGGGGCANLPHCGGYRSECPDSTVAERLNLSAKVEMEQVVTIQAGLCPLAKLTDFRLECRSKAEVGP